MTQARPYYADKGLSAVFYDVVTGADASLAGDVDLYAGLAPPGGSVLELGCGTGRIALALAARGLSVTGVDIAPAMLAQAEAARAASGVDAAGRLTLKRGDLTSLDLGRTFDLVLCPFFTLAHLPAGAAWRNAFKVMAKHLTAAGRCAVHLPLPELMARPAPPPDLAVMDQPLPGGGRLQLFVRERRFRTDIHRLDQVIDYVELDAAGRVLRRSPERLTYWWADPVPFAAEAGLTLDREPILLGGTGHVFVFRRS